MSEIFIVRADEAFEIMPAQAPCKKWPYAGAKFTPELRARFGLSDADKPSRILLAGTSQDYTITNGYLIPYYPRSREQMDRSNLADRNEELIIDRAHSFINNAQPELGILRTKQDIDAEIARFREMPEGNTGEIALKAGQFQMIAGAIMMRLEMLGRIISQHNTQGAKTEYRHLSDAPQNDEEPTPSTDSPRPVRMLSEEEVSPLKREAKAYYKFLTDPSFTGHLRTILLSDKKFDRDGILIDLVREIGKGLGIQRTDQEDFVRGNIVLKIGRACESIDQVHAQLAAAISTPPTADLFAHSISTYIKEHSGDFDIHSAEDVLIKLDTYASLCRARAGTRSDDPAYSIIYNQKSKLNILFNGENGLLQSMRRVGRSTGNEVSELREQLSHGIKLMERTAYTRTPCNSHAPDIWIPNFESDDVMEQFLVNQFISDHERVRSKRVIQSLAMLPAKDEDGRDAHGPYMRKEFCSLGRLTSNLNQLRETIRAKNAATDRNR